MDSVWSSSSVSIICWVIDSERPQLIQSRCVPPRLSMWQARVFFCFFFLRHSPVWSHQRWVSTFWCKGLPLTEWKCAHSFEERSQFGSALRCMSLFFFFFFFPPTVDTPARLSAKLSPFSLGTNNTTRRDCMNLSACRSGRRKAKNGKWRNWQRLHVSPRWLIHTAEAGWMSNVTQRSVCQTPADDSQLEPQYSLLNL